MSYSLWVALIVIVMVLLGSLSYMFLGGNGQGTATSTRTVVAPENEQHPASDAVSAGASSELTERTSDRTVYRSESIELPLSGSAPTEEVAHTIEIEDIRRGCFRQDCIPSVDEPEFISVVEAENILPENTIGIALLHQGKERFYPFPMLETHEIVNDVVAGDPLLITYCPLCGTGIVFDRRLDGEPVEFGVSGMLWQSNLLMYNRAEDLEDRNLWSQVLGEAVVGHRAGESLAIIPSDIVRWSEWKETHREAEVLTTGSPRDPYDGNYYGVARNFAPDFDEGSSPLPPTTYVYGIEIEGDHKAYPEPMLPIGTITDQVGGETVRVTKAEDGTVTITDASGTQVPDVEGFWFSWVAAHPETALWAQ